jgi:hypothetical protein
MQAGDLFAAAMHDDRAHALLLDGADSLDHLRQKFAIVDLAAADFDDVDRGRLFSHGVLSKYE